jgi:hypothetical protein
MTMATSQNGYSAPITPVSRALPGGRVQLRAGPAGDLLAWVGRQFHALVEPLAWPGCWGFADRKIAGSADLSNHASGTALDLNAPAHPLGYNPAANFRPGQIAAIRAIVARTGGCVRWGGDYTGRRDPMHFEIVAGETRCAAVLAELTTAGGETAMTGDEDMTPDQSRKLDEVVEQLTGSREAGEYPGWQSLKYPDDPRARATVTDFVRHIDENLINTTARVDDVERKLDEVLALLKEKA